MSTPPPIAHRSPRDPSSAQPCPTARPTLGRRARGRAALLMLSALAAAGCASRVPLDRPLPAPVYVRPPLPAASAPAPIAEGAPTPSGAMTMPVPEPGMAPPPGAMPVPLPETPASAVPPADAASQPPTSPSDSPLAAEQRWLSEWFAGTPVAITMQDDGALLVAVPFEFSFDPKQSVMKRPLAAVVQRVISSMSRSPGARVVITAPGDAGASELLASERTARIRDRFAARGIGPERIIEADGAEGSPVRLRLLPSSAP